MTQLRRKKVPGETVFKEIVRNNKLHKSRMKLQPTEFANWSGTIICIIFRKSCLEQEIENKIIKKNCLQKSCQNLQKEKLSGTIIPKFAK